MSAINDPKNVSQKLLMAFMANVETGVWNVSKQQQEEIAFEHLSFIWSLVTGGKWQFPALVDALDGFRIVMNPIVYVSQGDVFASNTTLGLYNDSTKELVFAVAGTNMTDSYDWFTEDFNTSEQIAWSNNIVTDGAGKKPSNTVGFVSAGTAIAIKNTWTTAQSANGLTPVAWLTEFMKANEVANLTVTGHSLGGAISPSLALALHDHVSEWNPEAKAVQINSMIYAGPTPGDEQWVGHVKAGVTVYSTYNGFDVVPHAWELKMMSELPGLYRTIIGGDGKTHPDAQDQVPASKENDGKLIYWLIEALTQNSKVVASPYERWGSDVEVPFSEKGDPSFLGTTGRTVATVINSMLSSNTQACTNAKYLCDVDSSFECRAYVDADKNLLRPYLIYFSEYLVLLGNNHIQQYGIQFLSDSVRAELKKVMPGSSLSDLVKVPGIIDKLLAKAAAYKKSVSPS